MPTALDHSGHHHGPGHEHAHAHAPHARPAVRLRPSWMRHSLAQRLMIVAGLLVPLWLAVLWALG
ncbi:MAG: hypothetical protein Q7T73_14435 [Beijerinckiaceae bacterium]|nr:hypothetical protein [Beijerinckiaceae bacterium]